MDHSRALDWFSRFYPKVYWMALGDHFTVVSIIFIIQNIYFKMLDSVALFDQSSKKVVE
jgi:hypothetical protein